MAILGSYVSSTAPKCFSSRSSFNSSLCCRCYQSSRWVPSCKES
nr:MAG TPA: hypothetical protein [Caudoviricetes sp.]